LRRRLERLPLHQRPHGDGDRLRHPKRICDLRDAGYTVDTGENVSALAASASARLGRATGSEDPGSMDTAGYRTALAVGSVRRRRDGVADRS
jgi:hypothetical protein